MSVQSEKEDMISDELKKSNKYCSVCGTEMCATKTMNRALFSTITGEQLKGKVVYKWRCPAGFGHDEFEV